LRSFDFTSKSGRFLYTEAEPTARPSARARCILLSAPAGARGEGVLSVEPFFSQHRGAQTPSWWTRRLENNQILQRRRICPMIAPDVSHVSQTPFRTPNVHRF